MDFSGNHMAFPLILMDNSLMAMELLVEPSWKSYFSL
jgi:hypothetical protein